MATRHTETWDAKYVNCPNTSWIEANITCNPTSFAHDPNNASQGKITWSTAADFKYRWVFWSDPSGHAIQTRIQTTSGLNSGTYHTSSSYGRWSDCNSDGNRGPSGSGTWVETTNANTSSTTFKQWMTYTGNWNDNQDWDFGRQVITHTLNNNYRILPPKGLVANLVSASRNRLEVTCSIDSWSDNSNIVGTPYTSGGGRNWNFRAVLSKHGEEIKNLTTNTGETKNAAFVFDNLELEDGNYTITVTCSNDFQQTATYTIRYKVINRSNLYGSVKHRSKRINILYGQDENLSTAVYKMYGSVDGLSKIVYRAWHLPDGRGTPEVVKTGDEDNMFSIDNDKFVSVTQKDAVYSFSVMSQGGEPVPYDLIISKDGETIERETDPQAIYDVLDEYGVTLGLWKPGTATMEVYWHYV